MADYFSFSISIVFFYSYVFYSFFSMNFFFTILFFVEKNRIFVVLNKLEEFYEKEKFIAIVIRH